MHLNSFNKLVKYLLETNEGVFRYSDLTGEPVAEPKSKYLNFGGEISQQEYEQAKKRGERDLVKTGTKTSEANKRMFAKDSYIKQLENMLSKHLKHKIVIFLNDTDSPYDYWYDGEKKPSQTYFYNPPKYSQKSHVTIEVPDDVIGIELSMLDQADDDNPTLTMLTPWMVGHRMGHQIFDISSMSQYKEQVKDILKKLLERNGLNLVHDKISLNYPNLIPHEIIPYEIAVKMFNFKSIKEAGTGENYGYDSYANGEFYNEIFAQYAKYGKVTIHYPGTLEERASTARQIEQVFSSWLDTLRGKVINIDE
jgi:hypothetical protein